MSTGLIIALIVVAAVAVLAAAFALGARRSRRGPALRRRFGPEYEVAVARHDGDTGAAERELAVRLDRHGDLRRRPLEPAERARYEARWTAARERFVDSPREAAAEADRLIADLAAARGFPGAGQYEEQLAALSVHHARHTDGYRRLHRAARAHTSTVTGGGTAPDLVPGFGTGAATGLGTGAGIGTGTGSGFAAGPGAAPDAASTEETREAMVVARALFEELLAPVPADGDARTGVHRPLAGEDTARHTGPARGHGRRDLSSALRARRTKEG